MRVPIFATQPYGANFEQVLRRLEADPRIEVKIISSPTEAMVTVQQSLGGVLLVHAPDRKTIMDVLGMLRVLRPMIRAKTLSVLFTSTFTQPVLMKKFQEQGVTDVLADPVPEKALEFKLRRMLTIVERHLEKAHQDANPQGKKKLHTAHAHQKEEALHGKGEVRWMAPLEIKSDCWLFQGTGVRKVLGRWMLTITGPSSSAGHWVRAEKTSDEDQFTEKWRWESNQPQNDPFLQEPGTWVYWGRRPELQGEKWSMVSNKPLLQFELNGQILAVKVQEDSSGNLIVARDSSFGLGLLPLIEKSFEKLIKISKEKEADKQHAKDFKDSKNKKQDEAELEALRKKESDGEGPVLEDASSHLNSESKDKTFENESRDSEERDYRDKKEKRESKELEFEDSAEASKDRPDFHDKKETKEGKELSFEDQKEASSDSPDYVDRKKQAQEFSFEDGPHKKPAFLEKKVEMDRKGAPEDPSAIQEGRKKGKDLSGTFQNADPNSSGSDLPEEVPAELREIEISVKKPKGESKELSGNFAEEKEKPARDLETTSEENETPTRSRESLSEGASPALEDARSAEESKAPTDASVTPEEPSEFAETSEDKAKPPEKNPFVMEEEAKGPKGSKSPAAPSKTQPPAGASSQAKELTAGVEKQMEEKGKPLSEPTKEALKKAEERHKDLPSQKEPVTKEELDERKKEAAAKLRKSVADGVPLNPLAFGFVLSELLPQPDLKFEAIAERFCHYLSISLGGFRCEFWVRRAEQVWQCLGANDQSAAKYSDMVQKLERSTNPEAVEVYGQIALGKIRLQQNSPLLGALAVTLPNIAGKTVDPAYLGSVLELVAGMLSKPSEASAQSASVAPKAA